MYSNLDHPKHKAKHTKIAKATLKKIANQSGIPYQVILDLFTSGDEIAGTSFWLELWSERGMDKKYNDAYYCPGCKKFDLSYDPQGPNKEELDEFLDSNLVHFLDHLDSSPK